MDEYITASEAAELFGFSRFYGAKLSRIARKKNKPYPVKIGRAWMAPVEEWEKIFNDPEISPRKERKRVKTLKDHTFDEKLITASEAGKIFGYSANWSIKLAKRSHLAGFAWPKKMGRYWLAPLEEWEKIFSSDQLKAWSKKK